MSEPRSWQVGRLKGDAHHYAIGALSSAEPHGVLNAGTVEAKVAQHPVIQRTHLRHGTVDAVSIDHRPHQPPPPGGADNGLGRPDVLRRVLNQQAEHDRSSACLHETSPH
jgi:hypothetical protein